MTQMHVDTDEANAVALQDATALSLYRQQPSGELVYICGSRLPASHRPTKLGRLELREREGRPRDGAFRLGGRAML